MTAAAWQTFWAMGGYGIYVWPSLGMCALIAVMEVVMVRRRHKHAILRYQQQNEVQ